MIPASNRIQPLPSYFEFCFVRRIDVPSIDARLKALHLAVLVSRIIYFLPVERYQSRPIVSRSSRIPTDAVVMSGRLDECAYLELTIIAAEKRNVSSSVGTSEKKRGGGGEERTWS